MPPFRLSAGILLYRWRDGREEVLLVHPGGPFWSRRDYGAWQIPKGIVEPGEQPATAARREFQEETGMDPPGDLAPLGRIQQAGNKWVEAFALEGDLDPGSIVSAFHDVEWPPRSGRMISVPEVDRADWFTLDVARRRMLASQRPLLDRLAELDRA